MDKLPVTNQDAYAVPMPPAQRFVSGLHACASKPDARPGIHFKGFHAIRTAR